MNDSSLHPSLLGLSPEELCETCKLEKKFQGEQIFAWLSRGISSFDEMTNLSIQLRNKLNSSYSIFTSKIQNILKDNFSIKLSIELHDKNIIEAVLLKDKTGRPTACLSSQVGCPLACAFCKTGKLGFARNLKASEIIEQFYHLQKHEERKIENIVFMGMGEPLLNIKELKKAINILTHSKGLNLSKRRITVSTAGVIDGIYELEADETPVRLAVSLTTASSALRLSLMPIEKSNPLPRLKEAIKHFNEKTGKRVTLEMALIHNVNTSKEMLEKIVSFSEGLNVLVNLIPWNPIEEINFTRPTDDEINYVEQYLKNKGLNVTIRKRKAGQIAGSCGQLGKIKKNEE
ncbi:MAG: 23S rRNA (adenine(2503)-C(2))-methyltransferase RlmN [Treponema sp.]